MDRKESFYLHFPPISGKEATGWQGISLFDAMRCELIMGKHVKKFKVNKIDHA